MSFIMRGKIEKGSKVSICVSPMPKYMQHQTFYSHCAFCQNQTIWNGCIFLEGLHPLLNSLISTRVVYFKPLFLQYKFLIRSITQSTSFISWFISKSDRKNIDKCLNRLLKKNDYSILCFNDPIFSFIQSLTKKDT